MAHERTPAEMKKALRDAGFEIYRTRGDVIHLAERVRENLLMDAGVYVNGAALSVGLIVRAERSCFPGEGEAQLFDRARLLAKAATLRGYKEVGTHVREVHDPGDNARTLDVWFEVSFERAVPDAGALMDEVRFAISIEKAAVPR
jgi:hypothetical protein